MTTLQRLKYAGSLALKVICFIIFALSLLSLSHSYRLSKEAPSEAINEIIFKAETVTPSDVLQVLQIAETGSQIDKSKALYLLALNPDAELINKYAPLFLSQLTSAWRAMVLNALQPTAVDPGVDIAVAKLIQRCWHDDGWMPSCEMEDSE